MMSLNPSNPTDVGPEASPELEELPASLAAHYDRLSKLIQRAHGTFIRELPELLKRHRGQWVAYHGDQRLGFSRDDMKLYKQWYARGVPHGELGVFRVVPYYPDEDIVYFGVD
jgi:hypothetical protein